MIKGEFSELTVYLLLHYFFLDNIKLSFQWNSRMKYLGFREIMEKGGNGR